MAYKKPIIIKSTIDTLQGKSVKKCNVESKDQLIDLMDSYGEDFAIQEVVEQFDEMKRFNDSSLNSFRIASLFLNGKFTALSSIVRVGAKGSVVDNVGAGGYAVGVKCDGSVNEFGFDAHGKIIKETYTGEKLSTLKLSRYEDVIAYVEKLHKQLPYVPLIGWDIALRHDGTPVMIELNASTPGIWFEQLCTGPLFGDRFDEVMEYVKYNRANPKESTFCNWRPDKTYRDLHKYL